MLPKKMPGQVLADQANPATKEVPMQLDWEKYTEIADKFQHKARYEDREDLRQDIIVRLAEVASNNGHKPLRVASYTVMAYWRDLIRQPSVTSLNNELADSDGNTIEFWQTLADDRAIDLDAWLEAKSWLMGCPGRLVVIAHKRANGKPLNHKEQVYLSYQRQKTIKRYQKVLTF
jgi:hypothetical protein